MSSAINIGSSAEFTRVLSSSTVVVADFYADWCGPCKAVAPTFESFSKRYSSPKHVTFVKVNTDSQQSISQQYSVRALPTFLIFHYGSVIETVQGADVRKLTEAVQKAIKLANVPKPVYSTPGRTLGGGPPSTGQSLARPFNFKKVLDAIITFLGLYLFSLFSFDAYGAAEASPFNIHKVPHVPKEEVVKGRAKSDVGVKAASGKRVGTLADLTG